MSSAYGRINAVTRSVWPQKSSIEDSFWRCLEWVNHTVGDEKNYEQLYSPQEVAYNNIEQFKRKQDRTDRTEKKKLGTNERTNARRP